MTDPHATIRLSGPLAGIRVASGPAGVDPSLPEGEGPTPAPQDVELLFQPQAMQDVDAWLRESGDRFLYIYGGRDPWSAPGVVPAEGRDARVEVLADGNHFTFIRSFPEERQQSMLETLRGWLD